MGKTHEVITPALRSFIEEQPMFFVATAPLAAEGHLNLSPKGLDTFRVLSPTRVAYLDLTGSGNETSAHLAENGRITVLFCSFSRSARILRLYGQGHAVLPDEQGWTELGTMMPDLPGERQIIAIDVERVQTSCGYGVPRMEMVEQRDTLIRWAESKGPEGLSSYRREKNVLSIDGLPTPVGEALGETL